MGFKSKQSGYRGLMQYIHPHNRCSRKYLWVERRKERRDKRWGQIKKSSDFNKNISTFAIAFLKYNCDLCPWRGCLSFGLLRSHSFPKITSYLSGSSCTHMSWGSVHPGKTLSSQVRTPPPTGSLLCHSTAKGWACDPSWHNWLLSPGLRWVMERGAAVKHHGNVCMPDLLVGNHGWGSYYELSWAPLASPHFPAQSPASLRSVSSPYFFNKSSFTQEIQCWLLLLATKNPEWLYSFSQNNPRGYETACSMDLRSWMT